MTMSPYQNAGKICNLLIAYKLFEIVSKLNFFGTRVTNKILIHKQI